MCIMELVLWSVKYRPKTWTDFQGQEQAKSQLEKYAASRTVPHLILHGPSGTGKTVAADIFAKSVLGDFYDSNFKSLNVRDIRSYPIASAKRNISDLAKMDRSKRTELDEYMSVVFREAKAELSSKGRSRDPNRSQLLFQAISLFASTVTVADKYVKILVLDEADALDNNMLQALRRTMEIYSHSCRFILITPSLAGWNPAIASRCVVIKFTAIKPDIMQSYLRSIAEIENVAFDDSGIDSIVREAAGDVRRGLDLLQICAATGQEVNEDVVYAHSETTLTTGVRKMVSLAISQNWIQARDTLRHLLASEQYSPNDIMIQIQKDIIRRPFDSRKMSHILERASDIDYRMTQGKNPHIHLMAFLASIGNIEDAESQ